VVRSGATEDGVDNQDTTPTLEARPVALEVLRSSVSYDDAAGTVQLSVTYNAAPSPADTTRVALHGPEACASEDLFPVEEGSVRALDVSLSFGDDVYPDPPQASATLTGFDGTVTAPATVSADGATITATVSHYAFAHRDWRCASGEGASDGFNFYFAGYAPMTLTAANSTRAFVDHLTRKYGTAYTMAARTYTKCAGITDADTGEQSAGCWAEFGTGKRGERRSPRHRPGRGKHRRDRAQAVRAQVDAPLAKGRGQMPEELGHAGQGHPVLQHRHLRGRPGLPLLQGPDVHRPHLLGLLPEAHRLPAQAPRRTYKCTNAMGDAIRWTPRRRA
jgi:hypothetical protein